MTDLEARAREAAGADTPPNSSLMLTMPVELLADQLAAFARTEVARALREDATARVRKDCHACDDGVYEYNGTNPIECEYCGRPLQSLRALADEYRADVEQPRRKAEDAE